MHVDSWTPRRLGDLVIAYSGGTPSRNHGPYWGGGIPWVTAKDMKSDVISVSSETLTTLGIGQGIRVVPAGSILMLCRGMGLFKDLPIGVASCPVSFNQDVKALVPRAGIIAQFLFLALKIRKHQIARFVSKSGHGTGRLEFANVADLEIPIPDVQTQQDIVSMLQELNKPIRSVERLISAKKKFRRELQRSLFARDLRGPGFSGAWRSRLIGDVFTERLETGREDLPLLSITSTRGVVPRAEIDRKDSSSDDKIHYKRIAPGDIGYNTMRMWQGVSALSTLEGIVSPAYTICVPSDCVDGIFISYLFKYPPVVNLFRRYSQGLVQDTLLLKFPTLAKIPISIPSIEEQKWIGTTLSALDLEISLLESYATALGQRSLSLTEGLMTGRLSAGEVVHGGK